MAMKLGDAAGSFTDINMTPLIDVMLVLLIIFIISLPPVTHAIKIDNSMPTKNPLPPPPPSAVVNLGIDFDGALFWNGNAVNRKRMQGYITEEAGRSPQPEVHISVDRFTKYDKVAETLADLQSRGLNKIGFVNNNLL